MWDRKWIKVLGIAMSLPSTIFVTAWGTMQLHEKKILSQTQAVLLFLAIIINMIGMMVYYALKRKD